MGKRKKIRALKELVRRHRERHVVDNESYARLANAARELAHRADHANYDIGVIRGHLETRTAERDEALNKAERAELDLAAAKEAGAVVCYRVQCLATVLRELGVEVAETSDGVQIDVPAALLEHARALPTPPKTAVN